MSDEHYFPYQRKPTLYPADPFDATVDANTLHKAMKGVGMNEKSIITILCHRGIMQRLEIAKTFKCNYQKDLVKELKSKSCRNLGNVFIALMTPLPYLYAKELHNAVSGLCTDEETVIEILCTSNYGIRTICTFYNQLYETCFVLDLKNTSDYFRSLCVSLCKANRDEIQGVDEDSAKADAEALAATPIGQWITDKSVFNNIIINRSYQQLRQIFVEYKAITGKDVDESIKKEFYGTEKGICAMVKCIKNKAEFFAERLYYSMKGLGTNDTNLIRIVVGRSEVDLEDIKQAFFDKYGKNLNSWIAEDTSGYYKKALLTIVQ